jgi:hypothetical protein
MQTFASLWYQITEISLRSIYFLAPLEFPPSKRDQLRSIAEINQAYCAKVPTFAAKQT